MEEINKEQNHGHACGSCHSHDHGHYLLRWVLGLIILAAVFGLGVKVGEFKASLEGGYFQGHMGQYNRMMYWGDQANPYRMMYPYSNATTTPKK